MKYLGKTMIWNWHRSNDIPAWKSIKGKAREQSLIELMLPIRVYERQFERAMQKPLVVGIVECNRSTRNKHWPLMFSESGQIEKEPRLSVTNLCVKIADATGGIAVLKSTESIVRRDYSL